jgi:hypothetical protein
VTPIRIVITQVPKEQQKDTTAKFGLQVSENVMLGATISKSKSSKK